jgi:hypothetical protein
MQKACGGGSAGKEGEGFGNEAASSVSPSVPVREEVKHRRRRLHRRRRRHRCNRWDPCARLRRHAGRAGLVWPKRGVDRLSRAPTN